MIIKNDKTVRCSKNQFLHLKTTKILHQKMKGTDKHSFEIVNLSLSSENTEKKNNDTKIFYL
jgi:hypothetical protein